MKIKKKTKRIIPLYKFDSQFVNYSNMDNTELLSCLRDLQRIAKATKMPSMELLYNRRIEAIQANLGIV